MPRKTLYIAYGSNINLQQMAYRCPTAKPVQTAMLKGFELQFKGGATIAPKENSQVPVLLWNLKPQDERNLFKDPSLKVLSNGLTTVRKVVIFLCISYFTLNLR